MSECSVRVSCDGARSSGLDCVLEEKFVTNGDVTVKVVKREEVGRGIN